tara:strand:+ start:148 stop:717 length:570 start_codon:yes stop_codon:yes gene_type:complete
MENQNQLTPTESLKVISEAINQTKENIKDQSFYYIMWGWLISIASFTHYVLLFKDFKQSYLPWLILMPIGWIVSITYAMKKEKSLKYETYLDVFLKNLWIVIGISFIGIIFISSSLKVNPTSFILLLAGIGTLVSGLTMKFKPLSIGGIMLFIFSIVSLFVGNSETLLVNGIAIIFGYLIPAYLLKKSK